MFSTRTFRAFILVAVSCFSVQGFSWGQKGHQTVEEVAIRLLPKSKFSDLLKNNIMGVKFLCMVPDSQWKHGSNAHPLEGQAHFFQVDSYAPRGGPIPKDINELIAKFGTKDVLANGTAPWRMHQMAGLLVNIMKKPNVTSLEVLQIAATLGHYVGDLANPLHVTKDYDGQDIGEKGLHSYFEGVSVNAIPDDELKTAVFEKAQIMLKSIPNDVKPIDGAFVLASKGHEKAAIVLNAAQRLHKTPSFQKAMVPTIEFTLASSAAILAKIWNEAYVLAGSPDLDISDLGSVPVPNWVPIRYIKETVTFQLPSME